MDVSPAIIPWEEIGLGVSLGILPKPTRKIHSFMQHCDHTKCVFKITEKNEMMLILGEEDSLKSSFFDFLPEVAISGKSLQIGKQPLNVSIRLIRSPSLLSLFPDIDQALLGRKVNPMRR